MLKLLLIRHAESKFNRIRRHQGQKYNSVLSDEGIKQAKRLAKRLRRYRINKIYSSDLKRTYHTAEILAKSQGIGIIRDKDLREYNWGDFTGKIIREKKWEKYYKKQLAKGKSKYDIKAPNGENIWDFIKRLKRFLRKIKKEKGIIAIVTHGGPAKVMLNLMLGILDKNKFKKISHFNTGISFAEFKNKKWKVNRINDARHIKKKVTN